ncbi:MAG: acyltransferase [Candidatus Bathyarchaeota archaeon]|nr:acyltransferase [Candidatus Bathyarchaeota archaeon]
MIQSVQKGRISEFDWLKVLGLLLLIFVHSELSTAYPDTLESIQWILIGIFFFVSGYLAYNSFYKRQTSLKKFFKTKLWTLYLPFVGAAVFYFGFESYLVDSNPLKLLAQISLLDIFDNINTGLFNYGFLWFIPYLLVFFFIFCLLEKYVKNTKLQVSIVLLLWFLNLLAWVFDDPSQFTLASFKLGLVFNQFFLVFMIGFWLRKFGLYERLVGFKTALLAIPLFALFWFNISSMFSLQGFLNSFAYYLYFNVRSMILGLSVIFVFLAIAKGRLHNNTIIESIAKVSILIYLSEPFISYLLRNLIFGGELHIYLSETEDFILYQALRLFILFGVYPLLYVAGKKSGFFSRISHKLTINHSV